MFHPFFFSCFLFLVVSINKGRRDRDVTRIGALRRDLPPLLYHTHTNSHEEVVEQWVARLNKKKGGGRDHINKYKSGIWSILTHSWHAQKGYIAWQQDPPPYPPNSLLVVLLLFLKNDQKHRKVAAVVVYCPSDLKSTDDELKSCNRNVLTTATAHRTNQSETG